MLSLALGHPNCIGDYPDIPGFCDGYFFLSLLGVVAMGLWYMVSVPAFQHAHVRATAARGLQLLISTTHLGHQECDVMARL